MIGGVLYSQGDVSVKFIESSFVLNYAMQASIVYTINSDTDIIISGGTIGRNGLYTFPNYTSFFDLVQYQTSSISESFD